MNYPLNDSWNFYFHAKNSDKKYSENTTKLITVSDIKDFWGTVNNIPCPTDMFSEPHALNKQLKRTGEKPAAISLFRVNSYPTWEDPTNTNGYELSMRKIKDLYSVNEQWNNIMALVVGENFEHSEILNGVRIVDCTIDDKIMYRIEFWFSDKLHKDYFENKIKQSLNIPKFIKLMYRDHCSLKETKK